MPSEGQLPSTHSPGGAALSGIPAIIALQSANRPDLVITVARLESAAGGTQQSSTARDRFLAMTRHAASSAALSNQGKDTIALLIGSEQGVASRSSGTPPSGADQLSRLPAQLTSPGTSSLVATLARAPGSARCTGLRPWTSPRSDGQRSYPPCRANHSSRPRAGRSTMILVAEHEEPLFYRKL